jgi:hypothetical protein
VLLHDEGHDTTGARLVVFSMAGFHSELVALAGQRPDVHLVGLPHAARPAFANSAAGRRSRIAGPTCGTTVP